MESLSWVGDLSMRFDIIPRNVWMEIERLWIEGYPPILKMLVSAGHAFGDRRSESKLRLIVSAWNSIIETTEADLLIQPSSGQRAQQEALVVLSSDTVRAVEFLRQKNKSECNI